MTSQSHDEPSEADVINMLNTYGDALERHSATPGAVTTATAAAPVRSGDGQDTELFDLNIAPVGKPAGGRNRLLVGAAALIAAAVIGGAAITGLTGDNNSEVTAADASEDQVIDGEEIIEEEVMEDAEPGDEVDADAAADTAESGLVESDLVGDFGFVGPGSVVETEDGLARLGGDGFEVALWRSVDGLDWVREPVTGFPEGAFPTEIVATDAGFVTAFEVFPDFELGTFTSPADIERFIATSDDLATWTAEPIGELLEDRNVGFVAGTAASGDTVVVLLQIEPIDEFSILINSGLVSFEDLETFCGGRLDGDAYVAIGCDFGEIVTEGSEPVETELARVEPGDELYDELIAAVEVPFQEVAPVALVGPVGGPYEIVELPGTGRVSSIVGTDEGFVVSGFDFGDNKASALSSTDGLTWNQPVEILGDQASGPFSIDHLAVSGDRILASGQTHSGDGELLAYVSDDLGATWAESPIPTTLSSTYPSPVGGDVGFAVQISGGTEEDPFGADFNPFGDQETFDVVKDGYTLTIGVLDGNATLTGPDGNVIHESVSEDVLFVGGQENVVRLEGDFDRDSVWLDPETGEDLVTITGEDIDAAVDELVVFDGEESFTEIPQRSEVWFSADGISWTLLDSSDTNFDRFGFVAAITDDGVVAGTEEIVLPPQELRAYEFEGRAPTEEETAALDAWWEESGANGGLITWELLPLG